MRSHSLKNVLRFRTMDSAAAQDQGQLLCQQVPDHLSQLSSYCHLRLDTGETVRSVSPRPHITTETQKRATKKVCYIKQC